MSTFDDDLLDELRLDDDADRALAGLLGGTLPDDHPVASLRVVVDEVRATGAAAPQPNAALAAILQDGLPPADTAASPTPTVVTIPPPVPGLRSRLGGFAGRVAALSMALKLALGVGAAAAAVGGAGAAGVLPPPAQEMVDRAFGLSDQHDADPVQPPTGLIPDDRLPDAAGDTAPEGDDPDAAAAPQGPDAAEFGPGVTGDAQGGDAEGADAESGVVAPTTAEGAPPDGADISPGPAGPAPAPAQPPAPAPPAADPPSQADDARPSAGAPPAPQEPPGDGGQAQRPPAPPAADDAAAQEPDAGRAGDAQEHDRETAGGAHEPDAGGPPPERTDDGAAPAEAPVIIAPPTSQAGAGAAAGAPAVGADPAPAPVPGAPADHGR